TATTRSQAIPAHRSSGACRWRGRRRREACLLDRRTARPESISRLQALEARKQLTATTRNDLRGGASSEEFPFSEDRLFIAAPPDFSPPSAVGSPCAVRPPTGLPPRPPGPSQHPTGGCGRSA